MDTLQTLKTAFRRIAPVGNTISLKKQTLTDPLVTSPTSTLYESGTAALAAAVIVARDTAAVQSPEVILPAYACPDLISAVIFAECRPVLVDIEKNKPYMQLEQVKAALNAQTVAIIAPWFLGIPERYNELRQIIAQSQILLIEDSAQWFLNHPDQHIKNVIQGDLAIYSFGKGKPVSLLGGGLLYCSTENQHQYAPKANLQKTANQWKQLTIWSAYNAVIHPYFYWLLELSPLTMGQTVYKPLDDLKSLPHQKQAFLQANINVYQQTEESTDLLDALACKTIELSQYCSSYQGQKRLRLAVLCESNQEKQTLLNRWQEQGLGASSFYPTSLPNIEAIPAVVKSQGPFPNAEDFANRLITLPTHQHIKSIGFNKKRP